MAVMQCLPGQDIPLRGWRRGCIRERRWVCRQAGAQREDSGGRGQQRWPMAHLPSDGDDVCLSEGKEGGCTCRRFTPSSETKLCLSILPWHLRKPGVANALSLLHTRHPSYVP